MSTNGIRSSSNRANAQNSAVNFYAPLPTSVADNGKTYKLTPAFDNVLNMFETMDGKSDSERVELAKYYLFKRPKNVPISAVQAAVDLVLGKNSGRKEQKVFDPIQDSQMIYASFRQAYGINLFDELGKLHWWEFNALLQGLPADTMFARIVQIRTQPLPEPTKYNAKERAELIRLKHDYALQMSEKEREENLQNGLANMARAMLALAKKKEVH